MSDNNAALARLLGHEGTYRLVDGQTHVGDQTITSRDYLKKVNAAIGAVTQAGNLPDEGRARREAIRWRLGEERYWVGGVVPQDFFATALNGKPEPETLMRWQLDLLVVEGKMSDQILHA